MDKLRVTVEAEYASGILNIEIPVYIVEPVNNVAMDQSYVEFKDGYFNNYSYIVNLTYDRPADTSKENVQIYSTDTDIISFETEKTDTGYKIKVSAMGCGTAAVKALVNGQVCECNFKVDMPVTAYVSEDTYMQTAQRITNITWTIGKGNSRYVQAIPVIGFDEKVFFDYDISFVSADESVMKIDVVKNYMIYATALKTGNTTLTITCNGFVTQIPVIVTEEQSDLEPSEPDNTNPDTPDNNYTGMAYVDYAWRYVRNGAVDFNYTGMASNEYGWWYFVNGTIDFNYTGMANNDYGWWYFVNGQLDFNYTGMASNEYGWWYYANGQLDFNYTGMASNEYGWWYMTNGALDFNYTGMASNDYGWWYMTNGALDWNYTGMACNDYGWWYMTNGALDWNYTGMALNDYGWWYMTNGALDWNYTGMALNDYGWWYITNGALDLTYTGTATNEYGEWQFVNGYIIY